MDERTLIDYHVPDKKKLGHGSHRPQHDHQEVPLMAASTVRHRSTHPGIYWRERADGTKSYAVAWNGGWVAAGNTEQEAVAKKGELVAAKLRGEKPVLPTKKTFAELAEQWYEGKATRLRPRTAQYYRSALDLVLLPRFGRKQVAAIDADAVAKLIRDLEREGLHAVDPKKAKRPLGKSSIDNYLKPLQGIMALAVRRRLVSMSPFAALTDDERPKREDKAPPHEWTDDELSALFAAAEANAAKKEARVDYTPILRLAARLGLRIGEILGLQWQDFDKDTEYLHVRRQWLRTGEYGPTKTKAGVRSIALPPDIKQLLLELRMASQHSQDEDPIFPSWNGTPLGHRNVTQRGWEAARDKAGLPKSLTFHDLRHAAASRLIDAGLDPVTVAGVIGHDDPSITLKVYAARFNRQRKDEAVRLALAGAQG